MDCSHGCYYSRYCSYGDDIVIDCFVNGSVKLSKGTTLKEFMEFMWDLKDFDGLQVVDKWVGFGALPDIKLVLENGHQISCKRLWQEQV